MSRKIVTPYEAHRQFASTEVSGDKATFKVTSKHPTKVKAVRFRATMSF